MADRNWLHCVAYRRIIMKIVETVGCISNDLTVEGKSLHELSAAQQDAVIERVLHEIRLGIADQTVLLREVLACLQYESCEYDDTPCDQCGDTVTTTTWIL